MLDYASADHSRERKLVLQAVFGAILTCIVTVAVVFLLILLAFGVRSSVISIVAGVAYLLGLAHISFRSYTNPSSRGWGMGMWIGAGLAMLIEGTCFIVNMR